MKHLEVREKYSVARRIFNSPRSVSSGDETLCLMLDILLETWLYGKNYNSSKGKHAFMKVTNNVRFMFCTQRHACTLG